LLDGVFEEVKKQLVAVKKRPDYKDIAAMLTREALTQLKVTEAIINSMTQRERRNPDILNASRRRRIATGSGTEVQEVNRLMKQFREAQKMFKSMQKTGGRGLPRLFG